MEINFKIWFEEQEFDLKNYRGWIDPNGKFHNLSAYSDSHAGFSYRKGYDGPNDYISNGAIRILWYYVSPDKYQTNFAWQKNKLSSQSKTTMIQMIKSLLIANQSVALEVYNEDWESNYKEFDDERALNFVKLF